MFERIKKRIEIRQEDKFKRERMFRELSSVIACDECGLVYSSIKHLLNHQKETGHKQITFAGLVGDGMDNVFLKAATMKRNVYYGDNK